MGEKPNFGSKLEGIENVTFDLSESALKARICKTIVENGKNDQFVEEIETKSSFPWQPNAKNRGSLGESDRRAHILPNNVGSLGNSRDNQQKWGHWVTAALKTGGLWSLKSASPLIGVPQGFFPRN